MDSLAEYLYKEYQKLYHFDVDDPEYQYAYENDIDNGLIKNIAVSLDTDDYIQVKSKKCFASIYLYYYQHLNKIKIRLTASNHIEMSYNPKTQAIRKRIIPGISLVLIIFGDNNSIYTDMKQKLIPLSVKKLISFKNRVIDNGNPAVYVEELISKIFAFYSSYIPFAKDVLLTIEQDNCFILPITFNELSLYKNKKDFFISKYKLSSSIGINWNKRNMNLSYLIIKSWNIVFAEHRNKLVQITTIDLSQNSDFYCEQKYTEYRKKFLTEYILSSIKCSDEEIAEDYIAMCLRTKEKVKLNFRSIKALKAEHDSLSEKYYMKATPIVKVKKDTRFKNLRKMLPENFEWIQSRKRLIHETAIQHHCVWSYADLINKDVCQIYSVLDENGERFTLEFRVKRNRYYLKQIRGKYNLADTSEMQKKINDLLKSKNILSNSGGK